MRAARSEGPSEPSMHVSHDRTSDAAHAPGDAAKGGSKPPVPPGKPCAASPLNQGTRAKEAGTEAREPARAPAPHATAVMASAVAPTCAGVAPSSRQRLKSGAQRTTVADPTTVSEKAATRATQQ